MKWENQYSSLYRSWRDYYRAYGGIRGTVGSPYFLAAVFLTGATYGRWLHEGWWEDIKITMPSLVGFTLGAYALLISVGNEKFRALIMGPGEAKGAGATPKQSPFVEASAAFAHFLFIQSASLIWAIVMQCLYTLPAIIPLGSAGPVLRAIVWCVGYLLFLYALLLTVSAILTVFRLSLMFDQFQRVLKEADDKRQRERRSGQGEQVEEDLEQHREHSGRSQTHSQRSLETRVRR
jgi:membrane protein implicated in regulation of membrane protease activity